MNRHAQSTDETYYEILNVKEDSSYEDIRQSYRSALLKSHPDKCQTAFHSLNSGEDVDVKFMKVQKAWETLSDSNLRALYDHKLRSMRTDFLVADDVALEDMIIEDSEETSEFYHQCRCGDYFVISYSELEEMGYKLRRDGDEIIVKNPEGSPACVVLPCGSCSLKIRLLVNTDDSHSVDGNHVKL